MKNMLAVILAGGRGERLEPLTRDRAKPAVPFGGTYRIIDFTLSNCLNSGIRRCCCSRSSRPMSLDRHINLGWRRFLCRELGEFIDVVPPQQRIDEHWYQGTADAVYQNIYTIEKERPEYVVILAGDHIYKMDYGTMVDVPPGVRGRRDHRRFAGRRRKRRQFGVMQIDTNNRVIGFEEKPADPKTDSGRSDALPGVDGHLRVHARFLFEQLLEDANSQDSRTTLATTSSRRSSTRTRCSPFRFAAGTRDGKAYWRDVGTLDAYYEANMDLVAVEPELNMYDDQWPIRTYQRNLPPPKFVFSGEDRPAAQGHALDSIVCSGCIVSGGEVVGSHLGPRVRINSFARVEDSILFDDVYVGRHAKIRRAIIEKGVRIPEGKTIGYDLALERQRGFTVTPGGVVVIPRLDNLAEAFEGPG